MVRSEDKARVGPSDRLRRRSAVFSLPLQRWVVRSGRLSGTVFMALRLLAMLDRTRRRAQVLQILPINDAPRTAQETILPAGPAVCTSPIDAISGERREELPSGHDPLPSIEMRTIEGVHLHGSLRTGWSDDRCLYIHTGDYVRGLHRVASSTHWGGFRYLKFCDIIHPRGACGVLIQRPRFTAEIPSALYVGGFALSNWYHWLTSGLPRLWLAAQVLGEDTTVPALVPERALRTPSIAESLRTVWGPRPVLVLPEWESFRIGAMLWVSDVSSGADILDPWGRPDTVAHHGGMFASYREALLKSLGPAVDEIEAGPPRVFLDRGGANRAYNRSESLAVAERFGFTPVDTAKLSFVEQVALFQRAEAVIGPTGAAWANLMFASPGARSLYWIPEHLRGTQVWSSLGAVAAIEMRELGYATDPGHAFFRDEYVLPADSLRSALDRLWI